MEYDRSLLDTSKNRTNENRSIFFVIFSSFQFDENIRRLLERFDASQSTEENNRSTSNNLNEENSTTTHDERQGEEVRSFIRQLNTWVREDLDVNLRRRLDFSTKAIEKLVRVFDKFV